MKRWWLVTKGEDGHAYPDPEMAQLVANAGRSAGFDERVIEVVPADELAGAVESLTDSDRHLLTVCIDRYIANIRKACREDQGTPEGKPNTVGHTTQQRLVELRARVQDGRL